MISLRFVLISVFIAYTAAYPAPVRVGEDHTDIARDEPAWVYEYLPAMQRRELEVQIRNQLLARYLDNLDLDARAVGRTGSLSRVPSSASSSALKKTPTLPPNHAPNANIVPKIVVTPPKVAEPQAPPPATPPKAVEPQARPPPSSKPPAQAPIVNANNAPPNAASSTNPPPGGPAPEGPPAGVPKVDSAKPPPTDVEKSKTSTKDKVEYTAAGLGIVGSILGGVDSIINLSQKSHEKPESSSSSTSSSAAPSGTAS